MEKMQDDDFVARSLSQARWVRWDEEERERERRCSLAVYHGWGTMGKERSLPIFSRPLDFESRPIDSEEGVMIILFRLVLGRERVVVARDYSLIRSIFLAIVFCAYSSFQ